MSQLVTISELNSYPVKSLRGIALKQSVLKPQGLPFDRHWMIVDANGQFVTQRQLPNMACISTSLLGEDPAAPESLILSHHGSPDLEVPLWQNNKHRHSVKVWGDMCEGFDQGEESTEWLTRVLGSFRGGDLRLVRFAEDLPRQVSQKHLQSGESAHTHFSDGYPFLVANRSSLSDLNDTLISNGLEDVPMARFRANIVIDGLPAWQENRVNYLEHTNGTRIALRKPCERCPVITTDQQTGERSDGEPLKTLNKMQTIDKPGAFFGQNSILLSGEGETLKVGDTLSVVF